MQGELTILGCGSAKPTRSHTPSSQVLSMRNKQYMIDCGEGAQIALMRMKLRMSQLNNIFISHLHGDHCFGLLGLISTWSMLERKATLNIHAHPHLQQLLKPLLDYFCSDLSYEIKFNSVNPSRHELIYEDKSVSVYSIPLKHRVPCCGFLFEEKATEPHIIKEMIDQYNIPFSEIKNIKAGADFRTEDGQVIENSRLTRPAAAPLRYAYCSDTAYSEKIIPWIEGADCLYHEATYPEAFLARAKETLHSTAQQAAKIAQQANVKKLIIGHYSARINDFQALLAEARSIFPNTELANEGLTFTIG